MAYDLAGVWSHRAKGNNPVACTRYNFSREATVWQRRRGGGEAAWGSMGGLCLLGVLPALLPPPGPLPPSSPGAAAAVAWYPPALLEEVLAVEDWEGLRLHLARLAAGGTLRALVPFGALAPARPPAAL